MSSVTAREKYIPRPDSPQERSALIAEAKSWLGTPYRDEAGVKGEGTDCAYILIKVAGACGFADPEFKPEHYARDFMLHRGDEIYLRDIQRFTHEIADYPNGLHPSALMARSHRPGDVALFRLGRAYAHSVIITDWPVGIHAVLDRRVEYVNLVQESGFWNRPFKIFSLWER